jgi:hypothetical protein
LQPTYQGETDFEFVGRVEYRKCTLEVQSAVDLEVIMLAESRKSAVLRRANIQIQKDTAIKERILATAASSEAKSLKQRLQWSVQRTNAYAALIERMESTVGLSSVKQFVRRCVADAKGRYALHEDLKARHVMLEGEFGTGKRTASELIALTFKLLGLVQKECGATTKKRDELLKANLAVNTDIDVLGKDSTHVVAIDSLKQAEDDGISTKTIYFLRLGSGSPKPSNHKDGDILKELEEKGCVVIFAGE